jgi:pimeloyl-ACP methyl ester carboxylesterase
VSLRASLIAATLCLPALAGKVAAQEPEGRRPALELAPCRLEHPSFGAAVSADCGRFAVPENRSRPAGRAIELYVARVPAINRREAREPLFVLAGGPGMAATTLYTRIAPALARVRRNRDIVLVDQRGTGRSNPLVCELDEDVMMRATPEVIAAESERCLRALSTRAEVAQYTSSVAVQDLDAVRAALGYERLSLYGSSYGTRVAQHYLRRFPARVRTVILDGVVPPDLVLGADMALTAEAALGKILDRCAAEAACREAFGDPRAAYRELRARLEARPEPVTLAHPRSGERRTLELGAEHFAGVLRLQSYTSEQAALLPLSMHLAAADGNFAPLAGQFLMTVDSLGVLAYGMHNTVVCAEDAPRFAAAGIDREKLRTTYIGLAQLEGLEAVCRKWPRGPVDADFHEPLASAAPVLLLSGGADPVTPPSFGVQAMRGLTNARHIEIAGLGHGLIGAPCMDRVLAQFLETADPRELDTSCLERVRPMPFFTSLAGPAP